MTVLKSGAQTWRRASALSCFRMHAWMTCAGSTGGRESDGCRCGLPMSRFAHSATQSGAQGGELFGLLADDRLRRHQRARRWA